MQFCCRSCSRVFSFEEEIKFCPFCGTSLIANVSSSNPINSNGDAELDSSMKFFFAKKDEIIENTRSLIDRFIENKIRFASYRVTVLGAKIPDFNFGNVVIECFKATEREEFFDQINDSLDLLENYIKFEKDPSDVEGVEFGDFYTEVKELDNNVSEVLKKLGKDISINPLTPFTIEKKVEIYCLSTEKNLKVLELLRQLISKAHDFVDENRVYFDNYSSEYELNKNFAHIDEDDEISDIIPKFNTMHGKTIAGLQKIINKEYTFDLLEEDTNLDEMMYVFWNGFYQLSEYAKKHTFVTYFCDDQMCDPRELLASKLDAHYRPIINELDRSNIELRTLTDMQLQEMYISIDNYLASL